MISVSEVVQRSLLIDDSDGGFLSADGDALDVLGRLAHLLQFGVDGMGCFHCSLSVEFGGVRDLEQNVLHDVGAVWTLEFERLALNEG